MDTHSQPHGTRWLMFGSIQAIKAVCTVATVTKEIALSALCQSVQIVTMLTCANPDMSSREAEHDCSVLAACIIAYR